MTSLQPLVALLAQTERQRDLALADHLKAQSLRDAAHAQAEQLVAYRREYEQRWSAQFCQQGRIELVRCYQGFITARSCCTLASSVAGSCMFCCSSSVIGACSRTARSRSGSWPGA